LRKSIKILTGQMLSKRRSKLYNKIKLGLSQFCLNKKYPFDAVGFTKISIRLMEPLRDIRHT